MINYFAPFCLSLLIHFGIILSFSDFFNINFDQFNIQSSKPVAAYIVFEEKKKTTKNPVQINQVNKKIKEKKPENQGELLASKRTHILKVKENYLPK